MRKLEPRGKCPDARQVAALHVAIRERGVVEAARQNAQGKIAVDELAVLETDVVQFQAAKVAFFKSAVTVFLVEGIRAEVYR